MCVYIESVGFLYKRVTLYGMDRQYVRIRWWSRVTDTAMLCIRSALRLPPYHCQIFISYMVMFIENRLNCGSPLAHARLSDACVCGHECVCVCVHARMCLCKNVSVYIDGYKRVQYT